MVRSEPPRSAASPYVRPSAFQETSRASLERDVTELPDALKARDEFVAAAANKLRNPMTPMLMRLDRLLAFARRPDIYCPEYIISDLEALEGCIDRYIRRANWLLDITRVVSGQLRLRFEPTNFSALVRATVQGYELLAVEAGSKFSLAIEDDVVGLWDRLALEQITDNLVSNAANTRVHSRSRCR